MGRIRPPIVIAMCGCGEILVKDYIFSKPYWTKYQPYVNHAKQLLARGVKIRAANCPGCGGNKKIKIGSFFHPACTT